MKRVTDEQVYLSICRFIVEKHRTPSYRDIRRELGDISSGSLVNHLGRLKRDKFVTSQYQRPRTLIPVEQELACPKYVPDRWDPDVMWHIVPIAGAVPLCRSLRLDGATARRSLEEGVDADSGPACGWCIKVWMDAFGLRYSTER